MRPARSKNYPEAVGKLLIAGIIPGLILGWIAADVMLQTYSSDQFTLDLQFRLSTILLSVGVIMLVAALSQIPGLRAIRRMDIAQVVRERSA